MASYLRLLGVRWLRMSIGPVLAVLGLMAELFGRFDEFRLGPYTFNVWLLGAVFALFVAQVRLWQELKEDRDALEERLNALEERRDIVERLGYFLDIGRLLLTTIESDSVELQEALEELTPEIPAERERLETIVAAGAERTNSWASDVSNYLREHLDYSYAARYMNDAGLVPVLPPTSIVGNILGRRWRDHDMRLQRLNQIIQELSNR